MKITTINPLHSSSPPPSPSSSSSSSSYISIKNKTEKIFQFENENEEIKSQNLTFFHFFKFKLFQIIFFFLFLLLIFLYLFHFNSNYKIKNENILLITNNFNLNNFKYDMKILSSYKQSSEPYNNIFMPIYTTKKLNEVNKDIQTVVISIHGFTRNAEIYFRTAVDAVKNQPHVMVITPFFSQKQLFGGQWDQNNQDLKSASLYWNTSGWMRGSNASPRPYRYSTSFDVMDNLLSILGNSELFPSLKLITIAGYSAGSQYTAHYIWATQFDIKQKNPNIHMRYLLSGSSMFLYFTPHRPSQSCINNYQLGLENQCNEFEIPTGSYLETCVKYDHWRYGVSSFPTEGYNYLAKYVNNTSGVEQQTILYRLKDVHYIIGDHDTCNCNTEGYINQKYCYDIIDAPREVDSDDGESNHDNDDDDDNDNSNNDNNDNDLNSSSKDKNNSTNNDKNENYVIVQNNPNVIVCQPVHSSHESCCDTYPDSFSNLLSLTCGSLFQGLNRFQRALHYINYLKFIWKDINYQPNVEIINGMGHDRHYFFYSKTFQNLISE